MRSSRVSVSDPGAAPEAFGPGKPSAPVRAMFAISLFCSPGRGHNVPSPGIAMTQVEEYGRENATRLTYSGQE
jgi:hypothetical protein